MCRWRGAYRPPGKDGPAPKSAISYAKGSLFPFPSLFPVQSRLLSSLQGVTPPPFDLFCRSPSARKRLFPPPSPLFSTSHLLSLHTLSSLSPCAPARSSVVGPTPSRPHVHPAPRFDPPLPVISPLTSPRHDLELIPPLPGDNNVENATCSFASANIPTCLLQRDTSQPLATAPQVKRGMCNFKTGKKETAIRELQGLIGSDECGDLLEQVAGMYLEAGEHQRALLFYEVRQRENVPSAHVPETEDDGPQPFLSPLPCNPSPSPCPCVLCCAVSLGSVFFPRLRSSAPPPAPSLLIGRSCQRAMWRCSQALLCCSTQRSNTSKPAIRIPPRWLPSHETHPPCDLVSNCWTSRRKGARRWCATHPSATRSLVTLPRL